MAMLTNRKSNVHSALSLSDVMAKHPRHPSLLHIKKHNVQERRKIFENNSSDASQNALSPTIKNYSTNQSQVDDIKQSISANRANDNKERIPFFFKEKMANDRKHFFDIQENLDDDTVDNTYQEPRSDFSKNKEEKELSNKYNYCTNFSTNPTIINENNDLTREQTKTSTSSTTTTAPRKALFFDHDSSDEIFSYKSWLDKKESAERMKKLNKDVTNTDNAEIDFPEKSHYSLLNKNRSSTSNDNQKKVDETATSFLTKINSISKIYDCEQRSNIADDGSTNIKPFPKASQSRTNQSDTNQSCNNQSSPSQQSTNLSKTSKETLPTINTSPEDLGHTKYLRSGSIPDHLPPKPPRLLQNLTSNNLKVSMINNTYYNEGGDVNNNNRSKKSLNSPPIYEFLTNTHSAMLPSYKTADEKSPACQTSKSSTFPKEGSPTSETLASLSYCKSDVSTLKEKYEKELFRNVKNKEPVTPSKSLQIIIEKSAESPDKKKHNFFKSKKSKVFVSKSLITNPNYIYVDPNEKDRIISSRTNSKKQPAKDPPTSKSHSSVKFKSSSDSSSKIKQTNQTASKTNKRSTDPSAGEHQTENKPLSARFASVHEEGWKKILSSQNSASLYDKIFCNGNNIDDDDDDDENYDLDNEVPSRLVLSPPSIPGVDYAGVYPDVCNITSRRKFSCNSNNSSNLNYSNNTNNKISSNRNNNRISSNNNNNNSSNNSTLTNASHSTSRHQERDRMYEDPTKLKASRCTALSQSVKMDDAGYAIPSIQRSYSVGSIGEEEAEDMLNDRSVYMRGFSIEERFYVKSKVSDAYAILRMEHQSNEPYFNSPMDNNSRSLSTDFLNQKNSCGTANQQDLIEHKKHLNYVSTVRQKTLKNVTKYEEVKRSGNIKLFEFGLIVQLSPQRDDEDEEENDEEEEGWDDDDDDCGDCSKRDCNSSRGRSGRTKVIYNWPEDLSDTELLTSNFCFPDASTWHDNISNFTEEMFSFFLTTATGDRKFCWCFRFLPTDTNIPEAICIVSAIGETCLYQQLLRVLKQAREYSAALARQTMQAAYKLKFPKVKKELYIVAEASDGFKYTGVIKRSSENHFSTAKFGLLIQLLPVGLLLQLMATILLERKVILVARRISTLSSCIMSICTLLYPFSWPHTLITVLPPSLADVIDSPAPYILGVLSCFKHLLEDYQLSEVLIVNLDEGYFMKWMGDEGHILPKKIQRALMLALSDVHLAHDNTGKRACITDVTMTEAFVRMFVEMCGHYCDFIRYDADKSSLFQREEFVRAVSSNSIRLFLDWFSRTPMFQVFITDRLKENSNQDLFDQRIKEYRREMEYLSNNKAANMKVIRDKLLNFFKNYGTKLKKTMKKNSYV